MTWNPEELSHGDILDIGDSEEFVKLQEVLHEDTDLAYKIVGSKLEDGNTTRLAVGLVSRECDYSFRKVLDDWTEAAVEELDWLGKGDTEDA